MKRLLFCLIFLLISFPAYAQMQGTGTGVLGVAAAAGCSVSTNEVGNRAEEATSQLLGSNNYMYCNLWTPDCSGTLTTAYLYHDSTSSHVAKVSIYLDDGDEAPDSGDARVDYTGVLTSTAAEWASGAVTVGAIVSTANKYWVCMHTDSGQWVRLYGNGISNFYGSFEGSYTTPPDTLNGAWTETANRQMSMYITIGP